MYCFLVPPAIHFNKSQKRMLCQVPSYFFINCLLWLLYWLIPQAVSAHQTPCFSSNRFLPLSNQSLFKQRSHPVVFHQPFFLPLPLPSFKPTVRPPQTWRERVANTAWSDPTGFCRPPGTRDPTPDLSTGSIHPRQLGCSRKFRRGRPITPSSRASALGHGVLVATCTQPVSPRTRPKGPTKTSHSTSSRITAWSLGRSWMGGPVWTILGSLPRG